MKVLLRYELRATVLTIGVCLWFLFLMWRDGELSGRAGVRFCVWFLVAAGTQLVAPNTSVWIVGLLTQLALAITLILKRQLSDIP